MTAPSSAAKQALHAAFGGAPAQETPAAKPTSGTQSRGGIMVDGKWIEHGAKSESSVDVEHIAPLDSPHKHLQLFELTLVTEKKRKVQAHLMLWPEGKLDLAARINDNDPRPQVLAEEGIRGLGMEERLADLQRWSMREWWDAFLEKNQQPIAASAGSRVVRSTDQVAFLHDPGYLVYRLYQAKNHILEGEYPMLMIKDGELSFSFLDLTGVDERERITPIRMQEILGDAALPSLPDLTFSAAPFHLDGEPLNLKDPERFTLLRDQMENIFQFPVLELPDPLGGTGSIRLHLGLWEMSQNSEKGRELRDTAIQEQCISFQASAGFISEIVRRELWRKKDQPARLWAGYTPKQISDSIRDNLYEDFHNMQGFQPKTPGDYQYNPETGEFQIVLRRKRCNHTLLMQGKQKRTKMLALLSIYGDNKRDGLDPLEDYSTLLTHDVWESLASGLSWNNGWMMAPAEESRCLWSDSLQRPMAPVVRHMPPWQQGVALGLFLMNK
ncbi:MAG: hypothetical protein EP343_33055 [Deltaproteobacteria bacterium]|nr:MAG: hypothetical protein EP343_33055 [Deltaproteobacteria bacterium]